MYYGTQEISFYRYLPLADGDVAAEGFFLGLVLLGDFYTQDTIGDFGLDLGGIDILGQDKRLLEFCVRELAAQVSAFGLLAGCLLGVMLLGLLFVAVASASAAASVSVTMLQRSEYLQDVTF